MMSIAENNSIIFHENVDINDMNDNVIFCCLLNEPLIFSMNLGLTRDHWEIGLTTNTNKHFLISTSSSNSIEVFKGQYDGSVFRYGYKNNMDRVTKIISFSKCKPIKIIEILYKELDRIKSHPYKLLYDNCHNNAIYQYLNIIQEIPNKELINIINKKHGFSIFT